MTNRQQLFCFTYAGGTASFFNIIEDELPGIDLIKLEYAGHGERHRESYYKDFNELADDMFHKLSDCYKGGEYSLFGYSMGSITMVEVLKRILRSEMKLPTHLFLAAHEPHTKTEQKNFKSNELDEWVKKRTIQFGDVPEKLINNNVFWRTYLPIYRADYSIIGDYDFDNLDLKVDIPSTIFYSETDTPLAEMKRWLGFFKGDCVFHEYTGTHFFIREHYAEMASVMLERLGVKHDV